MTTATKTKNRTKVWAAQPKQAMALEMSHDELFYGGAKGGGKSDYLLMDYWEHARVYGRNAKGIIFRRTFPELEELITRANELFSLLGGEFFKTEKIWVFKNGATFKMRFLERDADVHKYQGHQYSWIGFDELTNWATDYCYIFMISMLRSPAGVPCYLRSAGNPGSIGHIWVRERFVDIAKPLETYFEPVTGMSRVFVPAKLDDNIVLMKNDPQYELRLRLLPDYLYRAYRFGDWDVVAGAAFEELRKDIHGIDPTYLPNNLKYVNNLFDFQKMLPREGVPTYRSFDWGYSSPFSVGWWFTDYNGRLFRFKEWYGAAGANKGIKMSATDIAYKIASIEKEFHRKPFYNVADSIIWQKPMNVNENVEKLPSTAEIMEQLGIYFDKEISVMAKQSRIQGKMLLHERLRVDKTGLPNIFFLLTCTATWKTLPVVPLDPNNREDVDPDSDNHIYDDIRYMCCAKPMKSFEEKQKTHPLCLNNILEKIDRQREDDYGE